MRFIDLSIRFPFKLTLAFILFFLSLNIAKISYATPTGTGGHQFPLGSDAGDDFDIGSGVVDNLRGYLLYWGVPFGWLDFR